MLGYIKLSRSLKQTIKTSIKSNKQWFRVTAYTQPSEFCEHQLWRSVTVVQKVFTPHPVMLQLYSCRVFLALRSPFGSLLHKYNLTSCGSVPMTFLGQLLEWATQKMFCFFAGQLIVQFTLSLVPSQLWELWKFEEAWKTHYWRYCPTGRSNKNMTTAWFGDTLHQGAVRDKRFTYLAVDVKKFLLWLAFNEKHLFMSVQGGMIKHLVMQISGETLMCMQRKAFDLSPRFSKS